MASATLPAKRTVSPADFERNPLAAIRPADRVIIIGKTESGKTFFARYALRKAQRLVVLDPKGLIDEQEWRLVPWEDGLRDLQRGKAARVRVRPPLDGDWEPYLWACYNLGRGKGYPGLVVYLDELYGVGPAKGSPGTLALYTRGRELNISVWASTQRPKLIPPFSLSEAETIILFQTRLPQDMELMEELIPNLDEMTQNRPLTGHNFIAYNIRGTAAVRFEQLRVSPGVYR